MDVLFLILFLLSFFALIIGLIKPSGLVKKGVVPPTRRKILITSIPLMLIFIVLFRITASNPTNEVSRQQTQPPIAELQKKQTIYNLGMSPSEFKQNFNKLASELTLPVIGQLKIETGTEQDSFKYLFTDKLAILGAINKIDGSLRSVSVLFQPSTITNENMESLGCIGSVMYAVNPELTADQRGQLLRDLGLLDTTADLSKLNKTVIRNNKKYHCSYIKDMGFLFSVSDVNDGK